MVGAVDPIPALPLEPAPTPTEADNLLAIAGAFLRRLAVSVGVIYSLSYAVQAPLVYYAWRDLSGQSPLWTLLLEGAYVVAGVVGGAMIAAGGRHSATPKLIQIGAAILLMDDVVALTIFWTMTAGSGAGPGSGSAMFDVGANYTLRTAGHALPVACVFALARGAFARCLPNGPPHGTPG